MMQRVYITCKRCGRTRSTTLDLPKGKPLPVAFQFVCIARGQIAGCGWSGFVKMSLTRPPSTRVPNPKLGQKAKSKRFVTRAGPLLSVRGPKLKDPCYGSLSDADQKRAEEAQLASTLFMLEDKLHCLDCGALVGAKKSVMGSYYEPYPRPHEKPKPRRQLPRKPGSGSKRV
jgi:hypothetical protein